MSVESPEILSLLTSLSEGMRRLESEVSAIRGLPAAQQAPRTFYSVDEVATILGKSAYTVREWCRNGQVTAIKRAERRGAGTLWSISAEEVARYKNGGLLPLNPDRNNRN
jgi:Helix-turn-helix domain